jgi:hypothetical protein
MKIWTEEKINFLKENYPNNGAEYVANKLNFTINQVRSKIGKIGLNITEERKHRKKGNYKDSYNVEDITKNITNTNCYILGYLWTDGAIINNKNIISINILKEDMNEIEWMFNLCGKWHAYDIKRKNRQLQRQLSTYNPILKNSLLNLDFDKKSFISPYKIWNILNDEQKKYFFRGIIDGDGCFYINEKHSAHQFCIASTFEQDWSLYENIFLILKCKFTLNRREHKSSNSFSSSIRMTDKKSIQNLINWVYEGYEIDNIGLKRKYEKSKLYR